MKTSFIVLTTFIFLTSAINIQATINSEYTNTPIHIAQVQRNEENLPASMPNNNTPSANTRQADNIIAVQQVEVPFTHKTVSEQTLWLVSIVVVAILGGFLIMNTDKIYKQES